VSEHRVLHGVFVEQVKRSFEVDDAPCVGPGPVWRAGDRVPGRVIGVVDDQEHGRLSEAASAAEPPGAGRR
jgi:hypothetical protein